jgi:glycosyltransferase involved in cell wall biosynthesis
MSEIDNNKLIQKANKEFQYGSYQNALAIYRTFISDHPEWEVLLRVNVKACEAKLKHQGLEDKNKHGIGDQPRICVVFHAYHKELIATCLDYIGNISHRFKLFVTTPHAPDCAEILQINSRFPDAEVFIHPNLGRDILPFLKTLSIINDYDLCCKIHTKKGVSSFVKTWYDLCLEGLLGSADLTTRIINQFHEDRLAACAGPELLYGSVQSLMGTNTSRFESLCSLMGISSTQRGGFFMGSMLWFRPSRFSFLTNLVELDFTPEEGINDGLIEHSIERMLGSYCINHQQVILTRPQLPSQYQLRTISSHDDGLVKTFHDHFNEVEELTSSLPIGAIDEDPAKQTVSGWLASKTSPKSRKYVLTLDDKIIDESTCNISRNLPESLGVSCQITGFLALIDKASLLTSRGTYELYDYHTGSLVAPKAFKKRIELIQSPIKHLCKPKLQCSGFEEYISRITKKSALTTQISTIKASVVMPTFNRRFSIANSIASVLSQSFPNLELLIVDDSSVDDTEHLVAKAFRDERIRYIGIGHTGVSGARNVGIEEAKGDYLFFLDSDNCWKPHYLEYMISYLYSEDLENAYCGIGVYQNLGESPEYCLGEPFVWDKLKKLNFIDLNSFGMKLEKDASSRILFNTTLPRLVDWDFIIRRCSGRSVGFADFLGVDYYNGSNSRITNKVAATTTQVNRLIEKVKSLNRDTPIPTRIEAAYSQSKTTETAIILPTYNHQEYIDEAILSVLRQKDYDDWHLVIADDCSTDHTLEICQKYADLNPAKISVLTSYSNLGLSRNLLRSFGVVNSRFTAILEGDDVWSSPNKLRTQVDFLKANQSCSMVFNKIECAMEDKRSLLERQEKLNKSLLTYDDFYADSNFNLIANFSSCVFRTDVLASMPLDLFSPRFNEIVTAFYFSIFGNIGYIGESLSLYRIHRSGTWSGSKRINQIRSSMAIREKLLSIVPIEYTRNIKKDLSRLERELVKLELGNEPPLLRA